MSTFSNKNVPNPNQPVIGHINGVTVYGRVHHTFSIPNANDPMNKALEILMADVEVLYVDNNGEQAVPDEYTSVELPIKQLSPVLLQ